MNTPHQTRQPNPLNRWPGMPPILTERRFFVVVDRPLTAGALVNSRPLPAGAVLKGWQLHVCRSRGQVKKALRRIRQRHPSAYAVQGRYDKDTVTDNIPATLVLPICGADRLSFEPITHVGEKPALPPIGGAA
jgi:hypothetical protein